MKKLIVTTASLILPVLIACGSPQNDKSEANEPETGAAIEWVKFDDGLQAAAGSDKHVLAYFWRDG